MPGTFSPSPCLAPSLLPLCLASSLLPLVWHLPSCLAPPLLTFCLVPPLLLPAWHLPSSHPACHFPCLYLASSCLYTSLPFRCFALSHLPAGHLPNLGVVISPVGISLYVALPSSLPFPELPPGHQPLHMTLIHSQACHSLPPIYSTTLSSIPILLHLPRDLSNGHPEAQGLQGEPWEVLHSGGGG